MTDGRPSLQQVDQLRQVAEKSLRDKGYSKQEASLKVYAGDTSTREAKVYQAQSKKYAEGTPFGGRI